MKRIILKALAVSVFALVLASPARGETDPCDMLIDAVSTLTIRVDVFRDRKGRLPSAQEFRALAKGASLERDPWGRDWVYSPGAAAVVTSAGENGRPGDFDDVSTKRQTCVYRSVEYGKADSGSAWVPRTAAAKILPTAPVLPVWLALLLGGGITIIVGSAVWLEWSSRK